MCARPANPALRDEILSAALRIVEDCGPDCVTMREVAQKVGYSPTTLYLYFKDKRDILREVILRGFAELNDFAGLSMVGPAPLDKFRQRCRAQVVWGLMHPGLYDLMLQWRIPDVAWSDEDAAKVVGSFAALPEAIGEALAAGQLRDIADPAEFSFLVWAALHGVTSLAVSRRLGTGSEDDSPQALLARATGMGDAIVEGLLASHLA